MIMKSDRLPINELGDIDDVKNRPNEIPEIKADLDKHCQGKARARRYF